MNVAHLSQLFILHLTRVQLYNLIRGWEGRKVSGIKVWMAFFALMTISLITCHTRKQYNRKKASSKLRWQIKMVYVVVVIIKERICLLFQCGLTIKIVERRYPSTARVLMLAMSSHADNVIRVSANTVDKQIAQPNSGGSHSMIHLEKYHDQYYMIECSINCGQFLLLKDTQKKIKQEIVWMLLLNKHSHTTQILIQ